MENEELSCNNSLVTEGNTACNKHLRETDAQ